MTDLPRFKDLAYTTLSSDAEVESTSITVVSVTAITSYTTKPAYVTIWDSSVYTTPSSDPEREVVKVIAWNSGTNTITISSGLSYGHTTGERVSILVSAAPMNDMATLIESNEEAISTKENAFTKNTAFNKNFGTEAGTVCEGNDSRLSNDRNPTGHNTSHITGSDIIPDAVAGGNSGLMSGADKARLDGIVPGVHVNADWNSVSGDSQILNKPVLATVATSGSYTDLSDKPTIPAALDDLSGTLDDIVDGTTYVKSTNDYTDDEKSKLFGIELGATGDQTSNEILTAIKTVDGAGSGLDADTLDGNHAAAFAEASHSHSASEVTDFDTEVGNHTDVAANTADRHSHSNKAILDEVTAAFTTDLNSRLVGIEATADVTDATNVAAAGAVMNSGDQTVAGVKTFESIPLIPTTTPTADGQVASKKYVDDSVGVGGIVSSVNGENGAVVLDQDDVGDGITYKRYSQTEKTKLFGIAEGAEVNVQSDWDAVSGDALILNKPTIPAALEDLSGTLDDITDGSTYVKSTNDYTDDEKSKLFGIEGGATGDMSASEILTSIKTVDGPDSGLDADTLDGNHSSAFATSSHTQAASTITDFDTEVSNNTDVAANTSARHTHSNSAVLDATTASFLVDDETKLDGIEPLADVTDATNVAAAGAVMTSGDQTVNGVKTFGSFPVTPSSAPTADYQVANKKYVDDNAGTGTGAVNSVNGYTGVVVLDADDIADGTTNKAYTSTEQSRLSGIEGGATNIANYRNTAITNGVAGIYNPCKTLVDEHIPACVVHYEFFGSVLNGSYNPDSWYPINGNGSVSYSSRVLSYSTLTGVSASARTVIDQETFSMSGNYLSFTVKIDSMTTGAGGTRNTAIGFQPAFSSFYSTNRATFFQDSSGNWYCGYTGGSTLVSSLSIGRNLQSGDVIEVRLCRVEGSSNIDKVCFYVNNAKQLEMGSAYIPTSSCYAGIGVYGDTSVTTARTLGVKYVAFMMKF